MTNDLSAVIEVMKSNDSFLLAQHTHPDGDAVGSALALMRALENAGKKVVVYNEDDCPHYTRYLPGVERFSKEFGDINAYDVIVTLDCGDFGRVGEAVKQFKNHPCVVNIDHHASNPMFGRTNYVDDRASSTCEILYVLMKEWGVGIDEKIAECLYTGIYFDTRSFKNANSTALSMRICGEMVEAGVDPAKIARYLFIEKRPEQARLLSLVVPTLTIEDGGKIAGLTATADMFERAGADYEALEGFVEIPNSIEGVEAAYLLRELQSKDGRAMVKGSLRTSDAIDATVITGHFGGGGHKRAAGFTAFGNLEDVRKKLVSMLNQ